MRLEEQALLFDIQEACRLIRQFAGNRDYANYATDALCRSAVERQFITVGEALNRLGRLNPAFLERVPASRDIINFRNVLVHGYDRVEDAVVWGIIQKHLPALLDTVEDLLMD